MATKIPKINKSLTPNELYAKVNSVVDVVNTDVEGFIAPIESPAFSGTPTAPTPPPGDDTTKIATTEFVQELVMGRTPDVVVQSGIIGHGGTIPLPSGYTEDQCKWMVSPAVHRVDDDDVLRCYTGSRADNNSTLNWQTDDQPNAGYGRVVTCWTSQRGGGWANYIIIGVK